jgi:hypothetical protein
MRTIESEIDNCDRCTTLHRRWDWSECVVRSCSLLQVAENMAYIVSGKETDKK